MRQVIGGAAALAPCVLVLFLGAAHDGIIGSHGMSVTITVLAGLAAWLAIQRQRPIWDAVAAVLLTIGVATESTVLPFVLGAAVMIWLDEDSPRPRYWVAVAPLAVYVIWWLAWGHTEESDVAIANVAAMPSFAFGSLAASLASITGVFTVIGGRTTGFDVSAGQALAGGLLAVLAALGIGRGYRPGRASLAAIVALLSFWLMTSGVANAARVPWSSRYLYISVILLLLVFVLEAAASPYRRRATLILTCVCAFSLLPNIRELTYAGDIARDQAQINRAVMGAANLVAREAPPGTLLEDPSDIVAGQIADLAFPLYQYEASAARFGVPAYTSREIETAGPLARAAADHFLVRALEIEVAPATFMHSALPAAVDASQTGGVVKRARGCLRFAPLQSGAQLSLRLPPGGLWIRPVVGPPVPIGVRRFSDEFGVAAGAALGGRPSLLAAPRRSSADGWHAQIQNEQPLLLCAA